MKTRSIKTSLSCLILLSLAVLASAQEVQALRELQKDLPKIKSKASFYFIEKGIEITSFSLVSEFKVASPAGAPIMDIYETAEKTARKSGANALRLQHLENDYSQAIFEAYRLSDTDIERLQSSIERNTFYIFAGDKFESPEYYVFEVNGAAKSLKNGTYYAYTLKPGEHVKLRKGTVTGTIMWMKWKQDQLPNYYSIHGFYDEPVVKRTTVSESTKVGKFKPVESSFGAFLAEVLTPAPE